MPRGIRRGVHAHRETPLAELATTLAPGLLRGLVLELAVSCSGSYVGGTDYSDALTAAMKAYGIEPAPIEKATAVEFETRRAARGRFQEERRGLTRPHPGVARPLCGVARYGSS